MGTQGRHRLPGTDRSAPVSLIVMRTRRRNLKKPSGLVALRASGERRIRELYGARRAATKDLGILGSEVVSQEGMENPLR